MRVVALRNLVEGEASYRPGDTVAEGTQLWEQREYYARIGMVRVEDPLAPVNEVAQSVADFSHEALEKARAAAARIMSADGTPKRGRPKKDAPVEIDELDGEILSPLTFAETDEDD